MVQNNTLEKRIDSIIATRQENLPKIGGEIKVARSNIRSLLELQEALDDARSAFHGDKAIQIIDQTRQAVIQLSSLMSKRVNALEALKKSFGRNTINIALSGAARSGKSTTLQNMSGLGDEQLPSGSTKPLTAVTSRLFNSKESFASVRFRSAQTFVTDFVTPNLNALNECLDEGRRISIDSIDEFRHAELPSRVEGCPSVAAIDGLKRLKEAQQSLEWILPHLIGKTERIPLSNLKRYVSYPTNDDENAEERGEKQLERLYLAVDSVQIYCPFPNLGCTRIGLVDLPGLGEVSDAVARIHTKSLESDVDQVLVVARPSRESGYVDKNIGEVIDRLRGIQPGVTHRNDLITIGVNVAEGDEQGAGSLCDDIRRKINSQLDKKDRYKVIQYSAIDPENVEQVLNTLVERIARVQKFVDRANYNFAMSQDEINRSRFDLLERAGECVSALKGLFPNAPEQQFEAIQRLSSVTVDAFERLEQAYALKGHNESEAHKRFIDRVRSIKEQINSGIDANLLIQIAGKTWEEYACGRVDHFTFYREETRRIRREIVACYCQLDDLYEESIEQFKWDVLKTLLRCFGPVDELTGHTKASSADEVIVALDSEFMRSLRSRSLHEAFELLLSLRFQFRNNVFLQIKDNLNTLQNPPSILDKKVDKAEYFNNCPVDESIARVRGVLVSDAKNANEAISSALLESHDGFGETLEFYVSCFNDCLYRRDEAYFRFVIADGIIENYRNVVPVDIGGDISTQNTMKESLIKIEKAVSNLSVER